MSKKEKAMKTQKEAEVMQIASVPSEEADGVGVVMATEIIADLKKQLEEAKEEAKAEKKVDAELAAEQEEREQRKREWKKIGQALRPEEPDKEDNQDSE